MSRGAVPVAVSVGLAAGVAAAYRVFASPTGQQLGRFPAGVDGARSTGERMVALTFDDGPNEPFTSRLADLLAAEQVPATFFQVGRCVERAPEVSRRLVADGHTVGLHSWSHQVRRCLGERRIVAETLRTADLLAEVLGRRPRLYRPPWLLRTPAHFRVFAELDLTPVSGHFCHPLEVFQPAAARIAAGSVAVTRPGRLVIFHDGYNARGADRTQTVAAVALVITRLRGAGYRFVTADTLLDVAAYA